ncbi:MAG: hypothetical protein ABIJ96_10080 [Elusimicrobiota bacterium]
MTERWFAYIDKKLQGPYTAQELKALPGFGPDTEVTLSDHEEFWLPAKKDKVLSKLFAAPAARKECRTAGADKRYVVCPQCGAGMELEAGRHRTHCAYCESPLTFEKGKGTGGVLVAADCPSCGGMVQYPEDSRTAHCAYCDAYLVILGSNRLYRFYAPARITRDQAAAEARAGLRGWTPEDVDSALQLNYVPYWRYHAMVFYWNIGLKTQDIPGFRAEDLSGEEIQSMGGLVPGSGKIKERMRDFRSRRLDRSMRAASEPLGYPGAGDRVSRLPLRPYSRDEMLRDGEILHVVVTREEAEKAIGVTAYEGFKDDTLIQELEHGAILNGRLSVVYLPFWTVDDEKGRHLVLDGIEGHAVKPYGASAELAGRPPVEDGAAPPKCVLAQCARCGGELKIQNFQVLFLCPDCQRVWRIAGDRLVEQSFRLVEPAAKYRAGLAAGLYMPVWRLRVTLKSGARAIADQQALRELVPDTVYTRIAKDPGKPVYLYIQGWGNMVYPRLSKVPQRYTRRQPELEFAEKGSFGAVVRAVYGPEGVRRMPMLMLLGVAHLRKSVIETLRGMEIEIAETELLLIPCVEKHGQYIESLLGIAVGKPEFSEARR